MSQDNAGNLMSDHNANLGPYCEPCAKRRIKACHRRGQFLPDYTAAQRDMEARRG